MKPLPELTLDYLISELSELDDPRDACLELITWGRQVPELEDADRIAENEFKGCQNQVWLCARRSNSPGQPTRISFLANSDSQIVNGLILILMVMYNGKTGKEILEQDAREVFKSLGLERNIGNKRQSGLLGMVNRIRQIAAEVIVEDERRLSSHESMSPATQ